MITNHASPKSVSLEQIEKETCKGTTLQQVIESIQKNNGSKHLQPCYAIRNQLSICNNVLLKDKQIIIPKNFTTSRNSKNEKFTPSKGLVANAQS